jgi:hypothetical protein
MQPSDLKYPLCWVAYFDLLGFRSTVEQRSIWHVLEHYKKALDKIKQLDHWTPAKWFSDTFLFYTEDDSMESFGKISGASEVFFRDMLRNWIPVRGCLTFGEFYAGEGESLFGPALLDAYDEAEAQDWLGLILTRKAEDKMKQYPINGRTAYDVFREYNYRDYEVPFKKQDSDRRAQLRLTGDCRRLVYTINCASLSHGREDPEWASHLWSDLDNMQRIGGDAAKNLLERERIDKKYENTKTFLMDTVPKLSDSVRK